MASRRDGWCSWPACRSGNRCGLVLAWFMAASAFLISVSASTPSFGNSATPRLAPTPISRPWMRKGRGQRFQDAPGRLHHVGRIHDAGRQSRELVAARQEIMVPASALFRPRDGSRSCAGTVQPFRHALQREIAGIVPRGVVDDLEIVESMRRTAPGCPAARLFQYYVQALLEHDAVGQLGQALSKCAKPDSLFECLCSVMSRTITRISSSVPTVTRASEIQKVGDVCRARIIAISFKDVLNPKLD